MQAIRLHPAPAGSALYNPSNPAPTSALHLERIPIPTLSSRNQLLIKIHSTTIIRDTLTWPELYVEDKPYPTPGNDLSGTVVQTYSPDSRFKVGDEVFGMLPADRPGTWAEYVIAYENEVSIKPKALGWDKAAALPLSGLTAFEMLFVHGGIPVPSDEYAIRNWKRESSQGAGQPWEKSKKVLITGAAGAVGLYIIQLARLAGLHVTAASSSSERNGEILRSLGADEVIEYSQLGEPGHAKAYDIILDTVGGTTLSSSWDWVKDNNHLISVDSSSWNFVEEHTKQGIAREGVKALWFIVQGGTENLDVLGRFAGLGLLKVFVLDTYPLNNIQEAYDRANGRVTGRGKIIISLVA
ncbi:NADP-dependent oxidoreductase [Aspergillus stella-maris]|uniref:NADP-dependent oxidoreductase n=1 Tax=Aspergillus stella-maris TaxID=1810926 RepID=UPI003CCC9492